ncbi:inovirus Gp2 family protein [Pseudomonas nitroreducens]|uniref:inovirus Gp2 family protein n=1 Tax=Pseudomonas nitroreducens TaxID=46680 RepID=UPI003D2B2468
MFNSPPPNSPKWCGLPIQISPRKCQPIYLQRIHSLLMNCLALHPRWSVFRFDLKVPQGQAFLPGAITDFMESLKSQLECAQIARFAAGKRDCDPMFHYVWVREWESADYPHYHVALLLNRDAYFTLGDYSKLHSDDCTYEAMLAGRICKAWGVALGLDWRTAVRGVHFPERPVSPLQIRNMEFQRQLIAVFYRLSYFAKRRTKVYGDGQRNFGMSQLFRLQTERARSIS